MVSKQWIAKVIAENANMKQRATILFLELKNIHLTRAMEIKWSNMKLKIKNSWEAKNEAIKTIFKGRGHF